MAKEIEEELRIAGHAAGLLFVQNRRSADFYAMRNSRLRLAMGIYAQTKGVSGMLGLYHTTRQIEAELNIRALSLEFEIVLCLFEQGPLSASDIIDVIHASQAGFNNIARRLLADGILISTRSDVDRRVSLYSVSPHVVKTLSARLSRFKRT